MTNQSKIKAALARAYSVGVEPKFVSLAPGGRDEMWALGNMAFLVPVVPSDAPPELQFALRVRRNALLTGICDECRAVVGTAFTLELGKTDVAGTLVPHRGNCPAADDLVAPQLEAYYESRNESSILEDLDAASERTKRELEHRLDGRIDLPQRDYGDWAQQLVDQKLNGAVVALCDHLQSNVAQTWNMLLGLNKWHCDECWAYLEHDIMFNGFNLGVIEEHSCDYCGRYSSHLEPLVVRVSNFVMRGGMCRRCSAAGVRASAESARRRESHV